MVHVIGETAFLACQFLEAAMGAKRTFLLQFATQPTLTKPNLIDRAGTVDFPVAIDGDIHNPQVNAQKSIGIKGYFIWDVAGGKQIKFAFAVDQIAFALLVLQQRQLVVTSHKVNFLPATYQPDRDVPTWNALS
jgi:hypothetical protein